MASLHRVAITGIGLVSSLGEGVEPHRAALKSGAPPVVDTQAFAPYPVHVMAPLELEKQIPKKSDQRQMEPWQRIGVYAAGLALDDAGLKGDAAALDRLEMFVAAGGGERDHQVDEAIVNGLRTAADPAAFLNERLMKDLRPTLFLAQLPNLLAGNISIVHGVTGGSCSFMGEEQAGVDALRLAVGRIASGQSDAILVGAAYNAERRDMLLLLAAGGNLRKEPSFAPVFAPERGGMITGSVGAFLLLEAAELAAKRGARVRAEIAGVRAGRARREQGAVASEFRRLIGALGSFGANSLGLSAASGVAPWSGEEREAAADALAHAPIHASGDVLGHAMEAAFPAAVALAAAMIDAGDAKEALVTGAGHWRGEGAAKLIAPGR